WARPKGSPRRSSGGSIRRGSETRRCGPSLSATPVTTCSGEVVNYRQRMAFSRDVAIVGGCGRVGFPLGLAFADRGLAVVLYDIDSTTVDRINRGDLPFAEPGAAEVLARVGGDKLTATTDPTVIADAETIVVVIGTPVDEHLNPKPNA